MFTGIVEEIGTVKSIQNQGKTLLLNIAAKLVLNDTKIGDSISVNGVCLTVVKLFSNSFTADIMPITYQKTNLHKLQSGRLVNLERAMAANGRFGGHIVSGHIDGVGKIIAKIKQENAIIVRVAIEPSLLINCIKQGSIAIDGTSLTLSDVTTKYIEVSLIPHTQDMSILGSKLVGDTVNIECDMLLKKTSQNILTTTKSAIDYNFLEKNGYL